MAILTKTPEHWKDYELIDTGDFEKLERFGQYVVARPEPQAIWHKSLSVETWEKKAHAWFQKDSNHQEKGQWQLLKPKAPEKWFIQYATSQFSLHFKISLSSFKHVGVFPEQADNWDYIFEKVRHLPMPTPKILNLFAYTGGASLAAGVAGAEVTHVDSIKNTLSWARENMEATKLNNIRWMAEDALKFTKREVKRGKKYQGIILDPPAYGRGANGEKWILEENIMELLEACAELLDEKHFFLVINLYSLGFSVLVLENILQNVFKKMPNIETGEVYLQDQAHNKLPLGIFGRFASQ